MSVNITEIFGSNVFSTDVMRERLPKGVFREVMDVMENGGNISIETADIVANAMKDWAVERAPPTTPTGSSLSPASPRRSTTPSSPARKTAAPCFSSPASS